MVSRNIRTENRAGYPHQRVVFPARVVFRTILLSSGKEAKAHYCEERAKEDEEIGGGKQLFIEQAYRKERRKWKGKSLGRNEKNRSC